MTLMGEPLSNMLRGVFVNGQGERFRPILEMAEIFFGESSGPKTT